MRAEIVLSPDSPMVALAVSGATVLVAGCPHSIDQAEELRRALGVAIEAANANREAAAETPEAR